MLVTIFTACQLIPGTDTSPPRYQPDQAKLHDITNAVSLIGQATAPVTGGASNGVATALNGAIISIAGLIAALGTHKMAKYWHKQPPPPS